MTQRRPLCRISGANKELPVGDKPAGCWAKAIAVAAGGTVSVTIPSGFFNALPVIRYAIQATGTRDYVFRLSVLVLNADKTVTVTGVIRESKTVAVGGDSFGTTTSAVTLHLSAEESD